MMDEEDLETLSQAELTIQFHEGDSGKLECMISSDFCSGVIYKIGNLNKIGNAVKSYIKDYIL